ncbi:hypothetical protein F5Y17DRAFT_266131 [Xylariaceae sp. FL0594]|nr:hypothetical protein F5Y17DRAFT_266131 [Xylariaceae sp. FL0594]
MMDQYFECPVSYMYAYDYGYPATEQQSPPELSTSPDASVAMSRLPSGGSMMSALSVDNVASPASDYNFPGQFWVPVDGMAGPMVDLSQASSYVSEEAAPGYMLPSGGYDASHGVAGNCWSQQVVERESGLLAGPIDQPSAVAEEKYPTETVPRSQKTHPYRCEQIDCKKSFKRKADRDRHIQQVHIPMHKKQQYPCDWKRCQRAQEPFGRTDHQRDHFRDFHLEDVMWRRPSNKNNKKFWESRKVNLDWWRCSRCLERVSLADYDYECPSCKSTCEVERQTYRNHLAAMAAQGGSQSG